MAEELKKFKTGVTVTVKMTLSITGEVLTALPQIVITMYYIRNGKHIEFSFFAKDLTTPKIIAAIDAGKPVHSMLIVANLITMVIPPEDTENLEIEDCEEVPVFAEVAWIDSNGNTEKDLPDPLCDTPIGTLVGSVTTGLI